jgi:hypothetical protein
MKDLLAFKDIVPLVQPNGKWAICCDGIRISQYYDSQKQAWYCMKHGFIFSRRDETDFLFDLLVDSFRLKIIAGTPKSGVIVKLK